MRYRAIPILLLLLASPPVFAQTPQENAAAEPAAPSAEEEPSRRNRLLFYLPNRAFDLLDLVRARARIGPGLAVDARVTVLRAFVGAYGTGYAGLPGSRRERKRPRLLGPEASSGFKILFAGGEAKTENGPNYSPTEVGAGVQLGIVGVDVGVDPWEVVDLLAGFLLLEPRKDDL